jgi:hypothetical protein
LIHVKNAIDLSVVTLVRHKIFESRLDECVAKQKLAAPVDQLQVQCRRASARHRAHRIEAARDGVLCSGKRPRPA